MDIESKIGKRVSVALASGKTSQRTRNRLKENGSLGFLVEKFSKRHPALKCESVLVRSVSMSSDGSAWFGWLPCEEIEIDQWKEDDNS
jgi:hypothetical protein